MSFTEILYFGVWITLIIQIIQAYLYKKELNEIDKSVEGNVKLLSRILNDFKKLYDESPDAIFNSFCEQLQELSRKTENDFFRNCSIERKENTQAVISAEQIISKRQKESLSENKNP